MNCKNLFYIIPTVVFIVLILIACFLSEKNIISYLFNLTFCLASCSLGIIATFFVIDKYYQIRDISNNKDLFQSLKFQYNLLMSSFYWIIAEHVDMKDYKVDFSCVIYDDVMIKELNKLKQYGNSLKFRNINNERSTKQLNDFKDNFSKLENLILNTSPTIDLHIKCYPKIVKAGQTMSFLEWGIFDIKGSGPVNSQNLFLKDFIDFCLCFIEEIGKVEPTLINNNENKVN